MGFGVEGLGLGLKLGLGNGRMENKMLISHVFVDACVGHYMDQGLGLVDGRVLKLMGLGAWDSVFVD